MERERERVRERERERERKRKREREREREGERMSRGGAERGRHRIQSRLQALGCQHRARCGAQTHEL